MKRIRPTFIIQSDRGLKHWFMLWGYEYATKPATSLCGIPLREMIRKGVSIDMCAKCEYARLDIIRADEIAQRLLGPEEEETND